MEDLDGLPPRTQCAKLLALVLGDDGHPDEAAVRRASAEQVKKVLDGVVPTALEALRGFIGELTFQFCKVELTSRILGGASTSKEATTKERGLRQWIKAKVKTLDLGKYGSVTATQCYAAAQTMFRDAQRLLSAR